MAADHSIWIAVPVPHAWIQGLQQFPSNTLKECIALVEGKLKAFNAFKVVCWFLGFSAPPIMDVV